MLLHMIYFVHINLIIKIFVYLKAVYLINFLPLQENHFTFLDIIYSLKARRVTDQEIDGKRNSTI